MTKKQIEVLDKAEDLILWEVEQYLEAPEKMVGVDIYNFQILINTFARIQKLRFNY